MKSYRYKRYQVISALVAILLFITLVPGRNEALSRLHAAPALLGPGQNYTTPDGAFTLNYPNGWLVTNPSGNNFVFATDQKASDQLNGPASPTLNPGQVAVQLQYFSGDVKPPAGADTSSGAQAYLSSLLKLGLPPSYKVGKVQPVSLGNLDIASVTISDKGFEGVIYTFFEGKIPFLTAVATTPGELAASQFIAEAMIQSIRPAQATATMQPTMAATSAAINLSQFGTTPDKNYSFSYPAGWASQSAGNSAVVVGTSQQALVSAKLKSGEVVIQVQDFPKGGTNPPSAKFDAGPVALLTSLLTPSSGSTFTYSKVTAYKLGQIDAARVDVTSDGIAGVAYAFFVGDMPFVMTGATAPGETAANIALFEAVAQSIKPVSQTAVSTQSPTLAATQLATPAGTQSAANGTVIDLSQTFTFSDHVVQLNYPAGWVVKTVSGYVILANSDASAAAASSSNPQLGAGGLAILVRANLLGAGKETNDDLTNILKALMPKSSSIVVGPPASYQIGGTIDAIRIIARGTQLDAVGYAFKWNKNSTFIVVTGTAPGELFTDIPTVEAIIKSIRYVSIN